MRSTTPSSGARTTVGSSGTISAGASADWRTGIHIAPNTSAATAIASQRSRRNSARQGAQAMAAVERRPGMAVGVGDFAEQPGVAFLPRRVARQQQRAAHLAAAGQRHEQGVRRQPFAPVLGEIRRQVGSDDRKGAPVLALAVERGQHALEPDREGRVASIIGAPETASTRPVPAASRRHSAACR